MDPVLEQAGLGWWPEQGHLVCVRATENLTMDDVREKVPECPEREHIVEALHNYVHSRIGSPWFHEPSATSWPWPTQFYNFSIRVLYGGFPA